MKKVIPLILIMILAIGALSGCAKKGEEPTVNAENKEDAVPVEIINPSQRNVAISHTLSGKLSAIQDVMIMPELSYPAKVTSVNVVLGDRVSRGQVLFVLDDENIRKQIEQAEAAYNVANKNLESTREKIENAKVNFERIERLYKEGAVSKQQYEQAKLSASNTSIEALEAQVNQAKIVLEQARSELEKTIVKSPINGYAADVNVQENEFASSSQPAMRIVNTDKLKVNVGVSEQIINKIYKDQKVDVKVKVATDQILKGTVKAVSPVPDQRTQIYPVEIEIDNADNLIKPGMFAEILFDIEKRDNVLAIPSGAVQEDNGKKYVYVVENGIVKKRDIEIGLDNGNYVEIKSGLKEKDKVVVKGQNYVEDGEKVKVVRGDK